MPVSKKSARSSSSTSPANISKETKLRSSSKLYDIGKRISSLENSIEVERHNSRCNPSCKAKSRTAASAGKTGAGVKKNLPKVKQKVGQGKVTTRAVKKKPTKKRPTIKIHPIGRKDENDSQHGVEQQMDIDSNVGDKTVETNTRAEIHSDLQTYCPSISNPAVESEIDVVNPENASFNLLDSTSLHIHTQESTGHSSPEMETEVVTSIQNLVSASQFGVENASDIEKKSLNIYTQKSTGHNLPEIETEPVTAIQNAVSTSGFGSENVPHIPIQNPMDSNILRIRTRSIKPKELTRRTPGLTVGPSWYRCLYRYFYPSDED